MSQKHVENSKKMCTTNKNMNKTKAIPIVLGVCAVVMAVCAIIGIVGGHRGLRILAGISAAVGGLAVLIGQRNRNKE